MKTGDTRSEEATSSSSSDKPPKMNQKFAVGTQIGKVFDADGESQASDGNVVSFEYFEDEVTRHEHLLEADVANCLAIGVNGKKRAAESQANTRRVKRVNVSGGDARSTELMEKTAETSVANQVSIDALEKSEFTERKNKRKSRPYSRSIYSSVQKQRFI